MCCARALERVIGFLDRVSAAAAAAMSPFFSTCTSLRGLIRRRRRISIISKTFQEVSNLFSKRVKWILDFEQSQYFGPRISPEARARARAHFMI